MEYSGRPSRWRRLFRRVTPTADRSATERQYAPYQYPSPPAAAPQYPWGGGGQYGYPPAQPYTYPQFPDPAAYPGPPPPGYSGYAGAAPAASPQQVPAPPQHGPNQPAPPAPDQQVVSAPDALLPKALANLALRDLTLVESLLTLIQRLEGEEDDPKVLDVLYQVDHLGARMRRNCENLLVMARQPMEPAHTQPVALLDVVRATLSEISHYTRVRIQELPQVFVAERAADDITHLIAELLDNALANSAENLVVTVRGRYGDDGSLVLEVADDGIGIPAERLDRINAELQEPPRLTEERIRHMGLFVVAQLAHRHGLDVRLQTRPFSGTSGFVWVPPTQVSLRQSEGSAETATAAAAAVAASPAAEPPAGKPPAAESSDDLPPLPRRDPGRGPAGLRVVPGESTDSAHSTEPENNTSQELPELPRRQPSPSSQHSRAEPQGRSLPPEADPEDSDAADEFVPVRGAPLASEPGDVHSYAERLRAELSGFVAGQQEHAQNSQAGQTADGETEAWDRGEEQR